MNRRVAAIIEVDDDTAFNEIDDGSIAYFEREFGWLEQSGIRLEDAFLMDDDEDDCWKRYLNYLVNWAFCRQWNTIDEKSPLCFADWKKDNKP